MELDDLQQHAVSLASQAWPEDAGDPGLTPRLFMLLAEESGELAQAVRKRQGPRMGHPGEAAATLAQIEDELGDCLFLLARIGNATGASLERAAQSVVSKIERRLKDATDRAAEGGSSGIGPLAEVDG